MSCHRASTSVLVWRNFFSLGLLFWGILSACSAADDPTQEIFQDVSMLERKEVPQKRKVLGLVNAEVSGCVVDRVIFFDTKSTEQSADIDDDCYFSIELSTQKIWRAQFFKDGEFYSDLYFDNGGDHVLSRYYFHADGPDAVDLQFIEFADATSYPSQEPAQQCDRDGDGISDYDDDDDDGDDIHDGSEGDCDDDSLIDDFDLENLDCE